MPLALAWLAFAAAIFLSLLNLDAAAAITLVAAVQAGLATVDSGESG